MSQSMFVFLSAILAGLALIYIPLTGTFLASLTPFVTTIGLLTVLVFSFVIIYKSLRHLFNK